jgi:hypothetical protein
MAWKLCHDELTLIGTGHADCPFQGGNKPITPNVLEYFMNVFGKHLAAPPPKKRTPIASIVPFPTRGGNRWERALRGVSGRVTLSDHAIERAMSRHPDKKIRASWRTGVDCAAWMRRALGTAMVRRIIEHGDSCRQMPTFELLDLSSEMIFRAQVCPDRIVVATCFCKDVCGKIAA